MTKSEAMRIARVYESLGSLGFTHAECEALRRASRTLSRWFERECNGEIERDEKADKPYSVRQVMGGHVGKGREWAEYRYPIADRETGARKRIGVIVAECNARRAHNGTGGRLSDYIQTDPRGAALYIIRPGDVPEGKDVGSYYPHGVCVC